MQGFVNINKYRHVTYLAWEHKIYGRIDQGFLAQSKFQKLRNT